MRVCVAAVGTEQWILPHVHMKDRYSPRGRCHVSIVTFTYIWLRQSWYIFKKMLSKPGEQVSEKTNNIHTLPQLP